MASPPLTSPTIVILNLPQSTYVSYGPAVQYILKVTVKVALVEVKEDSRLILAVQYVTSPLVISLKPVTITTGESFDTFVMVSKRRGDSSFVPMPNHNDGGAQYALRHRFLYLNVRSDPYSLQLRSVAHLVKSMPAQSPVCRPDRGSIFSFSICKYHTSEALLCQKGRKKAMKYDILNQ